jgi:hypothetical protein
MARHLLRPALARGARGMPPRFTFTFDVVVGAGTTITPAIVRAAGCPYTARWNWGDGSALSTGDSVSHTYTDAGTYTVTLTLQNLNRWLKEIDLRNDPVVFDLSALTACRSLTHLYANDNASTVVTGALADLPATMTTLYLANTRSAITGALADLPAKMVTLNLASTSSAITGALADLPATMKTLHLANNFSSTITGALADLPATMASLRLDSTSSAITGALSDLPATMTTLRLYSTNSTITGALADLPAEMTTLHLHITNSTITGGASALAAVGIRDIQVQSLRLNQTTVDGILARLYADRALFTYATPSLNIGGTNDAPSGAYTDEDPPTTGLGYVFELANDPENEGFNTWSITYTGGSAP